MGQLRQSLQRWIPGLGDAGNPRVGFLIGGAQKGGTSALHAYLREHPEICMADPKEVHFFDNETLYARGTPNYARYHSHFAPREGEYLLGEATPVYMYWDAAPRRIWEYNPEMKWILVLRNPIERAFSHWNMQQSRNWDDLPFWEAIRTERERCREALPHQHRIFSYVDRGFYLHQLRRLWRFFSPERVLVLRNETLRARPNEALADVCNFLGVGRLPEVAPRDVHSRPYERGMHARERAWLQEIYEFEIRGLERVLGWDLNDWLDTGKDG